MEFFNLDFWPGPVQVVRYDSYTHIVTHTLATVEGPAPFGMFTVEKCVQWSRLTAVPLPCSTASHNIRLSIEPLSVCCVPSVDASHHNIIHHTTDAHCCYLLPSVLLQNPKIGLISFFLFCCREKTFILPHNLWQFVFAFVYECGVFSFSSSFSCSE